MSILRNLMVSTAPMLWAPDDVGNPTQSEKNAAEREKIKVTDTGSFGDKDDDSEHGKQEASNEETDKEVVEEDKSETEEDIEDEEEEQTADVKAAKQVEKLQKTIERLQRRIDKKTGSEDTLRKELIAAKKALEAKKEEGELALTEDEVNARAKKIAQDEMTAREFTRACNKLLDAAIEVDKKFEIKIKALAEDIGEIPSQMIGILDDLNNGGAVLAHLANNEDEAEKIWQLPLAKMTLQLVKISDKLEKDKVKEKKISKVPPPNEPVGGRAATSSFDPTNTKMSDKEWIEHRNKQVAERKAIQRASMR